MLHHSNQSSIPYFNQRSNIINHRINKVFIYIYISNLNNHSPQNKSHFNLWLSWLMNNWQNKWVSKNPMVNKAHSCQINLSHKHIVYNPSLTCKHVAESKDFSLFHINQIPSKSIDIRLYMIVPLLAFFFYFCFCKKKQAKGVWKGNRGSEIIGAT